MVNTPDRHLRIAKPPPPEKESSILFQDRSGVLPRASILTAAGVMILATISAYSFWLWALIQVLGLATEFQVASFVSVLRDGDFWDLTRTAIAIIGAGALTAVCWWVAVSITDDV